MQNLKATELKKLIQTVFPFLPGTDRLALLVDVPDEKIPDHQNWLLRRQIAKSWSQELQSVKDELHLKEINLFFYPNVHSNNADLPEFAFAGENISPEIGADNLIQHDSRISFTQIFETHQLFLAPTEFSTTAPLKLMAKKYKFRAATMPGFTPEMIPAMRLDYDLISARVNLLKKMVDEAEGALIFFMIDQKDFYKLYLDLRFRTGHSSTGLFPEPGVAGNLPSGECYIVPYEGEKGEDSQSAGFLPVQFDDEVVIYQIKQNRAFEIISDGPVSKKEAEKIKAEPAYANIAELGLGVLADFGIQPIGQILLDEKLGLHIAFGRSDHFGGIVGVKDFSSPETVEHTDRIYIPALQNRIEVNRVDLIMPHRRGKTIIEQDKYVIFSSEA